MLTHHYKRGNKLTHVAPYLSILHISDVHWGYHAPEKQILVTDPLINAVLEHPSKNDAKSPDICIFSGDLTQSSTDNQFADAEFWLTRLLSNWPDCRLFLVPGNHEVLRPTSEFNQSRARKLLRASSNNQDAYNDWRNDIGSLLLQKPFFDWHKNAKASTLNIVSDWTKSIFGCKNTFNLRGLTTHIIGLNTATLSCDESDKGNLVADVDILYELLKEETPEKERTLINFDKELVIVVGHHPVGKHTGASKNTWLSPWNVKLLENILLRRNGPHLYMHGHLHVTKGEAVSSISGQSIYCLGAGAAYQTEKYPMAFAFYELYPQDKNMKAWVYEFDIKSGEWILNTKNSHETLIRLPKTQHHNINKEKKEKGSGLYENFLRRARYLVEENKKLREENEKLERRIERIEAVVNRRLSESQQFTDIDSYLGMRRLISLLYASDLGPIHDFVSIKSRSVIHSNGDDEAEGVFTIRSVDKPIHFWIHKIHGDPGSEPMESLEKIEYTVIDDAGGKMTFFPLSNLPLYKEIAIFFFPRIEPGKERKFRINYFWPKLLKPFLSDGYTSFSYNFIAHNKALGCPFHIDILFDSGLGNMRCDVVNNHYSNATLKSVKTEKGDSQFIYSVPKYDFKKISLNFTKL
jgi:3',5'-cyclic AMP phosphodiesterase CpdA/regulator of replication initiation timing